MRVAFLAVVPSPYQRDLFRALAQEPEIELNVFYLEAAAPDSPWPEQPLAPYERVLRGGWFPLGAARCHVNVPPPNLRSYDAVVLNSLMSLTAQWLMRVTLRQRPWIFWGERLNRSRRWHERLTAPLHKAAAIAGIGSAATEDYRARFPEPQHFNIPYHCELECFEAARAARPANPPVPVFVFCGQMIPRKGVDLLLAAIAGVPHAQLLLVGREAELPALLAALAPEVRARVRYAGFQPPEELPRFFAQADVFVLPSRYDGWGVVVNQALGAGLPIICSDQVGAARDLVEEEVNGATFPSGDAAALTRQMQRLASEPQLIQKWGAASLKKAAAWHPREGARKWKAALQAVARP